jgi:uncharacterized protein (DUF1778 family)
MNRGRRKKSGTARMIEMGYSPLQIWLSPSMRELLTDAAARLNQPMTRYALDAIRDRITRRTAQQNAGSPPERS